MKVVRWGNILAFAALVATFGATHSPARAADSEPKTSPVAISIDPLPVKIEEVFTKLRVKSDDGEEHRIDRPLYLQSLPDRSHRLAVISQLGRVYIFPNDPNVEQVEPALDIHEKVVYAEKQNEQGLLGMAFHPKFKENGEVFLYYTTTKVPHQTAHLSRFHMADGTGKIDPDSEEVLFTSPEKPDWNHDGGTIIFGPDGYLYFCLGDGGAGNDPHAHGQSLNTVLGKILRIDVDHQDPGMKYAIPKDNPFVNVPDARGEIWALGLRNVWRMAFDDKTHWLWAGDVGQDTWEEVDVIDKGGNYGWNIREGFHKFTAMHKPPQGPPPEHIVGELIDPVFDYHHSIGKCIVGGGVYRGKLAPALQGKYIFADYVKGELYALDYDPATKKATSVRPIPGNPGNLGIFSFSEDENQEMYYTTVANRIYRFGSEEK